MFLRYLGLLTVPLEPSNNTWLDTLFTLGRLIFVCALVLVAAYYSTKWVATAKYKHGGKSSLRIIEAISVGNQSSVQLVKVGVRCVLIGVTRDRITMLTELSSEEIESIEEAKAVIRGTDEVLDEVLDQDSSAQKKPSFEKYLEKFFKS